MCYIERILFLLSLPLALEASQSSGQSVLSVDSERREFVVDEHGSSSLMRREGLASSRQGKNLKVLQKRLEERLLYRKQKLLALQQEMDQVHVRNMAFTPKCSVYQKYRLKAAGTETLRPEKDFASCLAACRPRVNVAKGKSAQSTAFDGVHAQPNLALDGKPSTEFISKAAQKPWWQVDLGEVMAIGDVFISSSTSLKGWQVGLRNNPCTGGFESSGAKQGGEETTEEEKKEEEEEDSNSGSSNQQETAQLLQQLESQLDGHQKDACGMRHTCGTIDENSNFVNCKGEQGKFVVITWPGNGNKVLRISEVEVWEDQVLSRKGAKVDSSAPAQANFAWARVLDGQANTLTKTLARENPWLNIMLAGEANENFIGKISIYTGPDRRLFAPSKTRVVTVGISDAACTRKSGCSKDGTLCGTVTATTPAGPYIVDCGGKNGKFVWIQMTGRHKLEIGEVEVEKSADCEQVVFTEEGTTKKCFHYAAYSALNADPEEGKNVTYTSAVCHTAGKVGPPGLTGAKGKKGDTGAAGAVGPAGPKGDKGDTGAMGEQGDVGADGPDGQEVDVSGLATMGQLNGAGVLCIVITVAVTVILMQKAQEHAMKKATGPQMDREEGKEEGFEEGIPEEAYAGEEAYEEEQPAA